MMCSAATQGSSNLPSCHKSTHSSYIMSLLEDVMATDILEQEIRSSAAGMLHVDLLLALRHVVDFCPLF